MYSGWCAVIKVVALRIAVIEFATRSANHYNPTLSTPHALLSRANPNIYLGTCRLWHSRVVYFVIPVIRPHNRISPGVPQGSQQIDIPKRHHVTM